MPFIKLFVVFVALGLSILIFTNHEGVTTLSFEVEILVLFKFPAKIVEHHYSSKLPCVYFEFPAQVITVIISISAVARASPSCRASFLFEFPVEIITVIITLSLSMSAVSLASFSVSHFISVSEFLPKTACYFLFSFLSS